MKYGTLGKNTPFANNPTVLYELPIDSEADTCATTIYITNISENESAQYIIGTVDEGEDINNFIAADHIENLSFRYSYTKKDSLVYIPVYLYKFDYKGKDYYVNDRISIQDSFYSYSSQNNQLIFDFSDKKRNGFLLLNDSIRLQVKFFMDIEFKNRKFKL